MFAYKSVIISYTERNGTFFYLHEVAYATSDVRRIGRIGQTIHNIRDRTKTNA